MASACLRDTSREATKIKPDTLRSIGFPGEPDVINTGLQFAVHSFEAMKGGT